MEVGEIQSLMVWTCDSICEPEREKASRKVNEAMAGSDQGMPGGALDQARWRRVWKHIDQKKKRRTLAQNKRSVVSDMFGFVSCYESITAIGLQECGLYGWFPHSSLMTALFFL